MATKGRSVVARGRVANETKKSESMEGYEEKSVCFVFVFVSLIAFSLFLCQPQALLSFPLVRIYMFYCVLSQGGQDPYPSQPYRHRQESKTSVSQRGRRRDKSSALVMTPGVGQTGIDWTKR